MIKYKFTTWWLVFIFVAGTSFGANRSLVIFECIPEQGVCRKHELILYNFADGYLQSRVKLEVFDVLDVRFDLGVNRIVQDRYIISHWGSIFDFRKKQLLQEGIGEVIGVEGNKVMHKIDDAGVEEFFVYDLSTKKCSRIKHPGKLSFPGKIAPDKKKSMSIDDWGQGVAYLHDLNGSKKSCASGLFAELFNLSSDIGKAPLLWIDNETVLSQRSNGKLILLKTTGTISPVVDIPIDEAPALSPSLSRGPAGEIFYYCGNYVYVINVKHQAYSLVKWMPVGGGFDIEWNVKPTRGQRIRYNGKIIGEYWCLRSTVATTEGHIALEYGAIGSNLGYPDGVVVWSSDSRKWTQLPIRYIHALIDWTSW